MRRHPLDLASLLAGLVFLGLAATYLLGEATGSHIDGSWVLPVALVALGAAGLAGGLVRATNRPPISASTPSEGQDEVEESDEP